jgi:hypothetical protein
MIGDRRDGTLLLLSGQAVAARPDDKEVDGEIQDCN